MRFNVVFKSVSAGSLMSTLVVTLIIATTCSLLLLGFYHTSLSSVKDEIDQRLRDDLQSATTLIMAQPRPDKTPIHDSTLLFNGEMDSIYYMSESWGCFTSTYVKVSYKGRIKETSFLHGASAFPFDKATLYLADHDRPLYLTGDSYIEGTIYLPPKGMNTRFFQQEGFSRKVMMKGDVDSSKSFLPSLRSICKTFPDQFTRNDTTTLLPPSIQQSFNGSYLFCKLPPNTRLTDKVWKGKLVILSESALEVLPGAQLEDVILIAPLIHFRKGFRGTVQAFARDSIVAESGCHFGYPSALVCCNKPDSTNDNTGATIKLQENVVLNGVVLALTKSHAGPKPVARIDSSAVVNGLVYSEGFTELYGRVNGAVYTHFFLYHKSVTAEENVLKDAVIVSSPWYRERIYSSVFTGTARAKLLKWLY